MDDETVKTELADFRRRLDILQGVITNALGFYAVWRALQLHDPSAVEWPQDRQTALLNRWNGFFAPTVLALQRMSLIEFDKVFDTDIRTASLPNLLGAAERKPYLIPRARPEVLADIRKLLKDSRAELRTLRVVRNQRLVHANANPEETSPLMSQRVERLGEEIRDAFNLLSGAHDGRLVDWRTVLRSSEVQTREVFGILHRHLLEQTAEFDDRMVAIVLEHLRDVEAGASAKVTDNDIDAVFLSFGLSVEQADRVRKARRVGWSAPTED